MARAPLCEIRYKIIMIGSFQRGKYDTQNESSVFSENGSSWKLEHRILAFEMAAECRSWTIFVREKLKGIEATWVAINFRFYVNN